MKTRITLFLVIAAVVTLSFTFASVKINKESQDQKVEKTTSEEPVGGFISEDEL